MNAKTPWVPILANNPEIAIIKGRIKEITCQ